MCGFVGVADARQLDLNLSLLQSSRDTLQHRGPDDMGYYLDSKIYLGFRRLSILDLSPSGKQPMATDDEKTWIVFNGEIYNYLELKAQLETKGYCFRGSSDTEVLLALYREYGTNMFAYLNGMFAIAIYDRNSGQILLARDRLGKKPLFYWPTGQSIRFASELSALRAMPGFPSEIDPCALGLYIRLGVVPNWSCIHPGVFKLPPASYIIFDVQTGNLSTPMQYWHLPAVAIDQERTETEWLDATEALLWDATRIRLRSDVPVGTFLSGGIDSGLVTAAAAAQTKGNLSSLTISFPEWNDNEWPLAEQTARHLGIHPIQRSLYAKDGNLLQKIAAHFDEPFADTSAIPTALISEKAREDFTVILSGDGGDELFAGYDSHMRAWRWRYLDRIPESVRGAITRLILPYTQPDSTQRRFLRRLSQPVGTWGMGAHMYPFEDWVTSCISSDYQVEPEQIVSLAECYLPNWRNTTALDYAQRMDMRLYMLDDILVKVDRMSMRASIELRSPFLDYRLVELALQIPPTLRVKYNQNKYVLRQLAKRHLPQNIADGKKRGFGIPIEDWLFTSQNAVQYKDLLLTSNSRSTEPFQSGGAERLWQLAKSNVSLTSALFRMLAYRAWVEGIYTHRNDETVIVGKNQS